MAEQLVPDETVSRATALTSTHICTGTGLRHAFQRSPIWSPASASDWAEARGVMCLSRQPRLQPKVQPIVNQRNTATRIIRWHLRLPWLMMTVFRECRRSSIRRDETGLALSNGYSGSTQMQVLLSMSSLDLRLLNSVSNAYKASLTRGQAQKSPSDTALWVSRSHLSPLTALANCTRLTLACHPVGQERGR